MDGHLPPRPDINIISTSCSISLSKCFAPDFLSSSTPYPAQEIFRNITFVHPECGDCLIDALVTASGTRGLSAFLPREMVYYPEPRDPAEWERSEPMLPLTSTWEGVDFSLDRVVRPGQDTWDGIEPAEDGAVRLREWCIKLLSRYAYTFGESSLLVSSRLDGFSVTQRPFQAHEHSHHAVPLRHGPDLSSAREHPGELRQPKGPRDGVHQ